MAHQNNFPFVLKTTAAITAVLTLVLVLLHHFFPLSWLFSAAISTATTCYHFTMRLAVGYTVLQMLLLLSGSVPEHLKTNYIGL